MKQVLFLIEHGWQAQRECSILLHHNGIESVCIIKGVLPKDIVEEITPYSSIRIRSLWRRSYSIIAFCVVLFFLLSGKMKALIVDGRFTADSFRPFFDLFKKKLFIIKAVKREPGISEDRAPGACDSCEKNSAGGFRVYDRFYNSESELTLETFIRELQG
ncbi:MAG: hypothetical protein JW844_04215 [Candidatus Omnitrophica bacterium]|nr:hypothetical protein [Candidatus Omnitrophota bacterium]